MSEPTRPDSQGPVVPHSAWSSHGSVITSRANPTFRRLMALHAARGITKEHVALVAGPKLVSEAARNARAAIHAQVVSEDYGMRSLPGIPTVALSRSLFRQLDVWGAGPPLLVVDAPEPRPWTASTWSIGCTVILPLQDPRNLGAALRCAAAFSARTVILTPEAAHPYHPDAIRPAAGAQGALILYRGPRVNRLASLPRPLLVLDLAGDPVHCVTWPRCFGLLVGMEGPGVPDDLEDVVRISIPTAPAVESLNATTALAIALHTWSLNRDKH